MTMGEGGRGELVIQTMNQAYHLYLVEDITTWGISHVVILDII